MKTTRQRIEEMRAARAARELREAKSPGTRAERIARVPSVKVTVDELRQRDGDACYLCGGAIDFGLPHTDPNYRQVDHVWPIVYGGFDVAGNMQLTHGRCNLAKSDRIGEADLDHWTEFLSARRIPFRINSLGWPVVEDETLRQLASRDWTKG